MSLDWSRDPNFLSADTLSKSVRVVSQPRSHFKALLGIPPFDLSEYVPPTPEEIAKREADHKAYEAKLDKARAYLDELGVYASELCHCDEEY